ncbi:MAG: MBOAT family protein [Saprospiraceae bacterium]|nr:MBOAT family protein [Saprospiraceae bacterium]
MLFNALEFAFFLPIVFCLYWLVAGGNIRRQNWILLLASYFFYGWWDWRFLSLIATSSLVDYFVGLNLAREEQAMRRKKWLWLSIGVNLGFLGFFKYYNFFADSFTEAFSFLGHSFQPSSLNIILPVGISFYTFQTMSYTIDIYRKKLEPTKDILAFFAFVSFFPQLVAGPIERASNLLPQFSRQRSFTYEQASVGLKMMLWGLFMKVAVADRLAIFVDIIYNNADMHNGLSFVVATVFFSFQIYCDFAGYSLMAIGCAQLFDFRLMENFRRPYFAGSFKDFWSRWHISLSTWFKDYVYIPLGGNRVSPRRQNFNLFITFVISGFWHGAAWTFVIWGAIHGLYQIIEKNVFKIGKEFQPRFFNIILIYGFTCLAWIFFRANSLDQAVAIIGQICMNMGTHIHIGDLGVFLYGIMALSVLFIHDLAQEYFPRFNLLHHHQFAIRIASILFLVMYIISLGIFDGSQFIYFQF